MVSILNLAHSDDVAGAEVGNMVLEVPGKVLALQALPQFNARLDVAKVSLVREGSFI